MKCRIIVLDTEYHGRADSRIAVMSAFEDKPFGATRDWPVRWRPWRCVSTPVDLDRMAHIHHILAAISRANLRHGFADGPRAWCQLSLCSCGWLVFGRRSQIFEKWILRQPWSKHILEHLVSGGNSHALAWNGCCRSGTRFLVHSPRTFTTTRVATSQLGAIPPADGHPLTYAFEDRVTVCISTK